MVERYVGYGNVPSVNAAAIEDVYAVGTRQNRTSTLGANTYFTAEVVVVELNENYRGKQEQVFIYDMPVVSGNVTIEEVGLIREDGSTANLRIDFEKSNIRYYQVAGSAASGWRNWGPGLYYLYTTGTEDLYTVEPMSAADIAANDYVVGWSATSLGTVKNDYISVLAFGDGSRAYGLVEKAAKSDSMIYTLAYNDRVLQTWAPMLPLRATSRDTWMRAWTRAERKTATSPTMTTLRSMLTAAPSTGTRTVSWSTMTAAMPYTRSPSPTRTTAWATTTALPDRSGRTASPPGPVPLPTSWAMPSTLQG